MNKPSENPRKALGKGLNALLSSRTAPKPQPEAPPAPPPREAISSLPIDRIEPNPLQPRTIFQPDRLQELAQSIKANGIIQPLVVRPRPGGYQLVAGERRWRAAKLAGLAEVPAFVQEISDDRLLEITLVENIQREDLNAIEVAQAFDRLIRELKLSHEEIAERTGKDRTTITNTLRLLKLPPEVQQLVAEHRLSMGHARAILGLPGDEMQRQIADKASAQGLSVRQVERLVQNLTKTRQPEAQPQEEPPLDPNVKAALLEMERVLGTRVRLHEKNGQRGRIEIDYYSQEDLDRIYSIIVSDGD